jgi:hypothetical protein
MLLAIRASSICANRFLRAFDALFAEVLHSSQLISVTLHRNHSAFCCHPPHYKYIFGSASSSLSKSFGRHTITNRLSDSHVKEMWPSRWGLSLAGTTNLDLPPPAMQACRRHMLLALHDPTCREWHEMLN